MVSEGDVVVVKDGIYANRTAIVIKVRGNLYDLKLLPKGKQRRTDIDGPGVVITNCIRSDFTWLTR